MEKEKIAQFKSLFETQLAGLTFSQTLLDQNFMVSSEDLADECDLTASELSTSMRMRLRNREALYAKKISEALQRINAGTFGACSECEESIELKRLEARPTATLCVNCKEDSERRELLHIDGHRHKSVGVQFKTSRTG